MNCWSIVRDLLQNLDFLHFPFFEIYAKQHDQQSQLVTWVDNDQAQVW